MKDAVDYRNTEREKIDEAYQLSWQELIKAGPVVFSNVCDIHIQTILFDLERKRKPCLNEVAQYGSRALVQRVLESFKYRAYELQFARDIALKWNSSDVCELLKTEGDRRCDEENAGNDQIPHLLHHRKAIFMTTVESVKKYPLLDHRNVLDDLCRLESIKGAETGHVIKTMQQYCIDHNVPYIDDDVVREEEYGANVTQEEAELADLITSHTLDALKKWL
jgi:hypothetical protein